VVQRLFQHNLNISHYATFKNFVNFQAARHFSIFGFLQKMASFKVVHPLKICEHKISWSHVDCHRFHVHHRSPNAHHFREVKASGFKEHGVESSFSE
jgi:hypothetical protein